MGTPKLWGARAAIIPGKYRRDLHKLDRPGQVGPLRLEEVVGDTCLRCLVVGRCAKGSQHLQQLVVGLTEARALHEARTTGVLTTAGHLSTIISRYRRILSCRPSGSQNLAS